MGCIYGLVICTCLSEQEAEATRPKNSGNQSQAPAFHRPRYNLTCTQSRYNLETHALQLQTPSLPPPETQTKTLDVAMACTQSRVAIGQVQIPEGGSWHAPKSRSHVSCDSKYCL
jgi:hypothetical protein